jgi:hypothetical protein
LPFVRKMTSGPMKEVKIASRCASSANVLSSVPDRHGSDVLTGDCPGLNGCPAP